MSVKYIGVIIANVIVLFLLVSEILKIRDSAFERAYHHVSYTGKR